MMTSYLAATVGSFSWWLTGWLASPGSPIVSLDHPNERSLHRTPTPRTGGVAILGSLYLGMLIFGVLGWTRSSPDESMAVLDSTGWCILMVTGVISIVSFMDDRQGLPIAVRFGVHLLAAALLVTGSGLVLPPTAVPMLGFITLGWFAAPFTVVFLVWMANLYNFMDGMDGFAGGMTVIGCGLLGYLGWQAHHPVISVIATLQCAAAVGFLIHNFPPAKIFMGDVGSVSTGFLVAALIVLGCRDGVFDLWVPLIVFSPFILDATLTLARRALHHEKVWEAHCDHYYQRLVLSGWSHRRTVLVEYGLMGLCGGFALFYQYASEEYRLVVLGTWGIVFLSLALAVKGLEQRIQPVGS
ncbi:MAG: glycosyltransferase family 4 protein [Nitrospirota bacterium]|nr:glycosyltransferase family 4 protein [Nitrospirota bacterium]